VRWAARLWSRLTVWGLGAIVGLRVEVRGLQHRPSGPALIAAKHHDMLDTIIPFSVLDDPCFVLKQELVRLPIYGWYVAKSGMIPIDRAGGAKAVKALSAAAQAHLREDRQIVIFPEGTRQEPGAPPAYKSGVALLYRDLGLDCTPLATNSGLFWPAHGLIRRPGVAVYEFLEPIPRGLKRAEFMQALEARIETASNALMAEARPA
jgi:1-acyl-sn-glycerol-3-phosphate acyltransferase